jgi:chromosome partitioning protein
MLILVTNSKGGVGKSTLATHLAILAHDAGYRTAVLDADNQTHTAKWVHATEKGIDVALISDVDEARGAIKTLNEHADVIIADTPGHDKSPDLTQALTFYAKLAIVPCQPSDVDVAELKNAYRYILLSQELQNSPDAIIVFNCTAGNDRKAAEHTPKLRAKGLHVADTRIRRLNAIRDAALKHSVTRLETPEGKKAAGLYADLFEEVVVPYLPSLEKRRAVNE